MSRFDRLALLLALIGFLASTLIAERVFEGIPHLEDEMAYVWEARVISHGYLDLPSPACPRCFLVPFVVDFHGLRFGKYPIGWPVVMALGILLGARQLVNPLLAGFTVWLIYLLVKKVLDEKTALLAAFLTVVSPFFLMNSASLLAHPLGLMLSASLALTWLDTFDPHTRLPRWLTATVAGLSTGVMMLTRPLTAVGVALPFAIHGIILLIKGDRKTRLWVLYIGILSAALVSVYFLWQLAVTGDLWKNPYQLWWIYDTIGFGPGVGLNQGGHSLHFAISNANYSLWVGSRDLYGWIGISYLFIPFGLIAILRNRRAWLVSSVIASLVAAYGLYWVAAWTYGPRYYFEALYSPVLLSAAGIRWLAGRRVGQLQAATWNWFSRLRLGITSLIVTFLVTCSLIFYIPMRIGGMTGLYDVNYSRIRPFLTAQAQGLTPALVVIHPDQNWIEYGNLLDITSPFNDSPFIFIYNRGKLFNAWAISSLPDRKVWYYYMDTPGVFYTAPRR
jgi:hypothetical protein